MPSGARFPLYDLEASIEVARILHVELGGNATYAELAVKLGYKSAANGAFINRMAASRLFGFIEGRGDNLSLSSRALAVVMPEDSDMGTRAKVEAFESVPLFGQFFDYFKERPLPAQDGMLNALQGRFGLPPDRVGVALDRLLKSAEQAGYFRTAPDRLMRPRFSAAPPLTVTPTPNAPPEARREERPTSHRSELAAMRGADHLLIQGALSELPDLNTPWDEPGLQQWLDLLETSARVIFKLPRPKNGKSGGDV